MAEDQLKQIHLATLRVLGEIGLRVDAPGVVAALGEKGALVSPGGIVRFPQGFIMDALGRLPERCVLWDRNGGSLVLGDGTPRLMGGGEGVFVVDRVTGKKRYSTRQDVAEFTRLQHVATNVSIVRPVVSACDWGVHSDLVEFYELLSGTDKHILHRTIDPGQVETAVKMVSLVAGSREGLKEKPIMSTLYCPTSPLCFGKEAVTAMMTWAAYGVPVTVYSMTLAGASCPASPVGQLVQGNAEVLGGIVMIQALHPGTPVIYGLENAVMDMKTGIGALGVPEYSLLNAEACRLGRRYGLPTMTGGMATDAKDTDFQAGFEKGAFTPPVMSQADIVFGCGGMDSGGVYRPAQVLLDDEIFGALAIVSKGFQGLLVPDDLDIDRLVGLIGEAGHGGHFLSSEHTLRNFRRYWRREILVRDNYEIWASRGASIQERVSKKTIEVLSEGKEGILAEEVDMALRGILRTAGAGVDDARRQGS